MRVMLVVDSKNLPPSYAERARRVVSESFRHDVQAKVQALMAKATQARKDVKARLEQRLATQKNEEKEYDKWLKRLGS